MLSTKLHNAINAQINAELWSAYLYLSMSLDAEAKGHKGVANWFYVQFQEEQDHARIFMNYLNSRDAKVELLPIVAVPTKWNSVLDMFLQTLEHEKRVTGMIQGLMSIAKDDKDYASGFEPFFKASLAAYDHIIDEMLDEDGAMISKARQSGIPDTQIRLMISALRKVLDNLFNIFMVWA